MEMSVTVIWEIVVQIRQNVYTKNNTCCFITKTYFEKRLIPLKKYTFKNSYNAKVNTFV